MSLRKISNLPEKFLESFLVMTSLFSGVARGDGFYQLPGIKRGFPGGLVVRNPPVNAGDTGSIPGLGRPPGEGNDNPFQYSCLEKPMDRGALQATAHGVTILWTEEPGRLQSMGSQKSST